jgi:RNA polymerase sigma factor (sigma-70 family)
VGAPIQDFAREEPRWHGDFIVSGMLQLTQAQPLSHSVACFLRGRDELSLRDEDPEAHLSRLLTALMVGFRDTGRSDLFDAIYRLAQPRLVRWVTKKRRGTALRLDPEDLTQEVFLSIHRYRGSFKEQKGGFRAWSMTIAHNLIRRQAQELLRKSMRAHLEDCDPPDLANGPRDEAINREEALLIRNAWQLYLLAYAKAFDELKPRDQEALRLVEIEGLRYAEAADRLGVGLSNMKMILLRARHRIRLKMGIEERVEHKAAG